MKILLVLVLAIACLVLALMIIGPEKLWHRVSQIEPVELSTWPGRSTPNWALACPDTSGSPYCRSAERTHTSPAVIADKDAVYEWFIRYATGNENPGTSLVSRDDARRKARFEALSSGLKFPDIIDLEVVSLEDGKVSAAILSQSLLGMKDFGVNSDRLNAWLKAFQAEFSQQ